MVIKLLKLLSYEEGNRSYYDNFMAYQYPVSQWRLWMCRNRVTRITEGSSEICILPTGERVKDCTDCRYDPVRFDLIQWVTV